MAILNQKTINKPINFEGITLHKGKYAKLKILPSSPNSGISFKRVDLTKNNIIVANFCNVSDATLCTTLSNQEGVDISTVEHLMAALYGMGVDNALIEIDQDEIPIMDGSSKKFVQEIKNVGLKNSDTPIKIIKILNKVEIFDNKKYIRIEPTITTLEIDFEIKFNNDLIGNQRNLVNVYEGDLENIYNSRTFCLYEDVEKLKKMGLGKGGNLDNAIVVKENKILNDEKLRNTKEFVNHKILDCMGDLYLSGYRIVGSFQSSQGGHSLTNKLLRKIFSDKQNYSLIQISGKNLPHSLLHSQLKAIA